MGSLVVAPSIFIFLAAPAAPAAPPPAAAELTNDDDGNPVADKNRYCYDRLEPDQLTPGCRCIPPPETAVGINRMGFFFFFLRKKKKKRALSNIIIPELAAPPPLLHTQSPSTSWVGEEEADSRSLLSVPLFCFISIFTIPYES